MSQKKNIKPGIVNDAELLDYALGIILTEEDIVKRGFGYVYTMDLEKDAMNGYTNIQSKLEKKASGIEIKS